MTREEIPMTREEMTKMKYVKNAVHENTLLIVSCFFLSTTLVLATKLASNMSDIRELKQQVHLLQEAVETKR